MTTLESFNPFQRSSNNRKHPKADLYLPYAKLKTVDESVAISTSYFSKIPDPVKVEIVSFLALKDLAPFSLTCHKFKYLVDDEKIWKPLSQKYFHIKEKLYSQTWKAFYFEMKAELKAQEEEKQQVLLESRRHQYACGMRCPPRQDPLRPAPTVGIDHFVPVGGFKVHPNTNPQPTISFGVELQDVASELLKFLRLLNDDVRFEKKELVLEAMRRYDMFMKLKVKYPQTYLVPTVDIEMIWQCHLLRPLIYKGDCLKIYGTFIDHALLANHTQQSFLERGLIDTAKIWMNEYKEDYCTLPDPNEVIPRFCCPPFSGLQSIMPKSLYWNRTTVDLEKYKNSRWINPFQLTPENVIADRKWLAYYDQFIGEEFVYMEKRVITRALKAYERFLYMAAKYPPGSGELVHPTYVIDVIWHSHMINPRIYQEDSLKYVGYIMDHDPWPEVALESMQSSYSTTNSVWEKEFAIPMEKEHQMEDWGSFGSHMDWDD